MNVEARTLGPRFSRMYASTMPIGCPRLYITSQISPAPAAQPISRKTLARNITHPLRYAATTASSIVEARAAKQDSRSFGNRRPTHFANLAKRPQHLYRHYA